LVSAEPDTELGVQAPDEPIISVRGLVTKFGNQEVHSGLNFDVKRGEIIGVVGPSGTGKSVLLRQIIGLHKPMEGEIHVFGENLMALTEHEKDILERRWGVLFQEGALFSTLSLRENVALPMREHTKLPNALVEELADLKLMLVGLEPDSFGKRPSKISGGMRKRAGLARAISLDPELLFLDEPTAGLDPVSAEHFDQLILQLRDALGLTVFLVTHDLDTLEAITDRIIVLLEGKVEAIGPIAEVRGKARGWVKDYFSGPRGRAALNAHAKPAQPPPPAEPPLLIATGKPKRIPKPKSDEPRT
jgi:phospholipid/cholesterol/gamma-HCH transport system ATP-binding protein